eukprot:scaffold10337_cov63-Cyclotella_meneghiniana.AAC.3
MSRQLYQWLHLWAVIALVLLTTISQKTPFAKAAPQGSRRKVSRAEALRQAQEHASREQEKINARIAKKKEDGDRKTQELKDLQEQVNMMNDVKRERENSRNDPHEQAEVQEPEL